MSITTSPTIYVGNLPSHLDESSLAAHFSPFGDIVSISVPSAGPRGNKGFAFITFSTTDEAEDALDNMHLNAIQGRTIYVNLADPNKVKDNSANGMQGRKGRAVWDDDEWLKKHAANDDSANLNPAAAAAAAAAAVGSS